MVFNYSQVYDFGFYLHQESYVGGTPQVFQDRIAKIEQQTPYFLVFGRQLLRGGALGKVWVEVRLPEGSGYPCATSEQAGIIAGVLRQQLDQSESYQSPDALASAIEYIETHIDKLYNCCSSSLRSSTASCDVSEEYIEDILSANGYFHYGGLPVTIEDKDYQAITSEKNIIIQLDNRCGLKLYGGVQELRLTDDLEDFVLELESAGKSSDVEVFYYDDSNAHEFLFDHLEGGEETSSINSGENAFYREEIFVLNFEGAAPKVYFSFTFNGTTTGAGLRAAGVPSWMKSTIKWFFKRASTNPTTVVVGVATEYTVEATVEYWFNADQHDTWLDALWAVIVERGIWGAAISVGQNAFDSPVVDFIGTFANHFVTTPSEQWDPLQALVSAMSNTVFRAFISTSMKVKFPALNTLAVDVGGNGGLTLLRNFFLNRNLVTAWQKMLDATVPSMLRKNLGALNALITPKWLRPPPSDYLDAGYIANHLDKFDEGAIRFTTQTNIANYGTLGPDKAFVMAKSEFDDLISETGGDLSLIESALKLDLGTLSGGDVVIAWIKKKDFKNLKIPRGDEPGANDNWLPGGYTGGGYSEAVLDISDSAIPYERYPF